jgi:hypothetical protein
VKKSGFIFTYEGKLVGIGFVNASLFIILVSAGVKVWLFGCVSG